MTGADTPAPAIAAPAGKWGITYDYINNCTLETCLTTMYWNWGPLYAIEVKKSMDGTFAGRPILTLILVVLVSTASLMLRN